MSRAIQFHHKKGLHLLLTFFVPSIYIRERAGWPTAFNFQMKFSDTLFQSSGISFFHCSAISRLPKIQGKSFGHTLDASTRLCDLVSLRHRYRTRVLARWLLRINRPYSQLASTKMDNKPQGITLATHPIIIP